MYLCQWSQDTRTQESGEEQLNPSFIFVTLGYQGDILSSAASSGPGVGVWCPWRPSFFLPTCPLRAEKEAKAEAVQGLRRAPSACKHLPSCLQSRKMLQKFRKEQRPGEGCRCSLILPRWREQAGPSDIGIPPQNLCGFVTAAPPSHQTVAPNHRCLIIVIKATASEKGRGWSRLKETKGTRKPEAVYPPRIDPILKEKIGWRTLLGQW